VTEVQIEVEREIRRLRRAVATALYGCLVSMIAALAIGIGTLAYANHLDDRQRAEAREQERGRAVIAEQTRQLFCQLAIAQRDAFSEAASEPGRKSQAAWAAMAVRFNCT
jgi:hypothetical protein